VGATSWMLNATGVTIPKGSLVAPSTLSDDAIVLTAAGGLSCCGVAETDILTGQYGSVVLTGFAQVLIDNTTGCNRGDWIGVSAATTGQGTAGILSPVVLVGQACRAVGGAGLVWCEIQTPGTVPSYLRIGQHDTSRSPIGLWQLNGDLLDTSGYVGVGSPAPLSLGAGVEQYVPVLPGSPIKGFYLGGTSYVYRPTYTDYLSLIGEMTIEYITFIGARWTAASMLVGYGAGAPETLNTNFLYSVKFSTAAVISAFWEYGAGSDVTATSLQSLIGWPTHHAFVRRTGGGGTLDMDFYQDGHLINTVAGNHVPAIGVAPTQALYFGYNAETATFAQYTLLASVCIIAAPLNAAQVLADAKKCLPWLI